VGVPLPGTKSKCNTLHYAFFQQEPEMKQMMLRYYTDGMIDYFIILYMMLLQEFESIARPSGFYETLLTLAYKCQFGVEGAVL
jgi:hypothetical protein